MLAADAVDLRHAGLLQDLQRTQISIVVHRIVLVEYHRSTEKRRRTVVISTVEKNAAR